MLQLIGNVTKDATAKQVNGNKQVINFSIALNDGYKNAQGEWVDQTTYIECAFWSKANVASYLTTGRLVELYGRIYADAYTNGAGEAKGVIRCTVNKLKFHNSKATAKNTVTSNGKGSKKKRNNPESAEITEPVDDLPF